MRAIWSALIVLVLLAPFGGVGITTTPVEAEIVASPRGPAVTLAKPRIESERPVAVIVAPVVFSSPGLAVRTVRATTSPSPILVIDRYASAGPRAPPV
jgi:hypothetical protein